MAAAKEASRLNLKKLGPQSQPQSSSKNTSPSRSPQFYKSKVLTPTSPGMLSSPSSPNKHKGQRSSPGPAAGVGSSGGKRYTPSPRRDLVDHNNRSPAVSPPSPSDFILDPFSDREEVSDWVEKFSVRHKRSYWRNKRTQEVTFKAPH